MIKRLIYNTRRKFSRVFFATPKLPVSNDYTISIKAHNFEYDFCKISTIRIVKDDFIVYKMTIDNELIREVFFFKIVDHENLNGNLFCTKRYNVKDKEPIVIYKHSPETLAYINKNLK